METARLRDEEFVMNRRTRELLEGCVPVSCSDICARPDRGRMGAGSADVGRQRHAWHKEPSLVVVVITDGDPEAVLRDVTHFTALPAGLRDREVDGIPGGVS